MTNVTQRTLQIIIPRSQSPGLGMPEVIEERYLDLNTFEEKLLKKTIQTYSSSSQIIRQEIYDANDSFCYSLSTSYNAMGLPEIQSNPLGQITHIQSDPLGNPIRIEKPDQELTTLHRYDCSNRLIQTTEKNTRKEDRTIYHTYDGKHNRISTTDPYGNTTHFTYDAFGNILTTELPPVTGKACIHTKTYNSLYQEVSSTDPRGYKTQIHSTIRNKPCRIIHPNGSEEIRHYNLNGTLRDSIDQEGTKHLYTYDIFENILSKKIYSSKDELLSEETFTYDAFHLLSQTDPEGNTTTYSYDGAGRKIAETLISHFGTEEIIYIYDSLGRLQKTQQGDLVFIQEHDLLDRIIEEREEDLIGNIITRTLYGYDAVGNKTTITRFTPSGPSTTTTKYDTFQRPICIEDPLGNITTIQYEDLPVHRKITTDPMKVQTIEIFNAQGALTSLEKRDPSNKQILYEKYSYDLSGNLIHKESCNISTTWIYGPNQQLLSLTEAAGSPEQRTTTYTYTPSGLIKYLYKPDGTTITHTYDPLGRLIHITSSDNTCSYTYHYNRLGQIQSVEDHIHFSTIYRTYDPKGRLRSETLPYNKILISNYNRSGQRIQLILPDQSSIRYFYYGTLLTQIKRYSSSDELLYTHRYLTYDLSGHLLSQQLINNQEMHFTIDSLERPISTESSYFTQQITAYSPVGTVLQTLTQNTVANYRYDILNQLVEEPSHTYTYDFYHNRLSKDNAFYTYDHLHQILNTFTYNLNGAPILHENTRYTYDAFDRLNSIETPTTRHTFTYDAFHRRLSDISDSTQYFLYDDQNEIGSYDINHNLCQLRILGVGHGAEIGAAIALELDNTLVIPIHDLFGNIITLIDPYTNIPLATYEYTAFGEQKNAASVHNPWGFSSKRHDADLIYFGRRYYDPRFGRWLTPDPAGYTQGPNLYAYLRNTPLCKVDLYGLFSLANAAVFGKDVCEQAKDLMPYMRGQHPLSTYHYYNNSSTPIPNDVRPPGMIILVNGINTSYEKFTARIDHVATSYGVVCHGIYNPTHNPIFDVSKCLLMKGDWGGSYNSTVRSIQELCVGAITRFGPTLQILLIPHSKGCLDTLFALQDLPDFIRQQIHIAAFAPATVMPERLAGSTINYASKGLDFVVLHNIEGVCRGLIKGNLVFLSRGHGADWFGDHAFDSPTFDEPKDKHLAEFKRDFNCTIPWTD
ncbi:MAG: RHS repeat-associated core domain-containing protein [Simkania negevensis]|nr:RHS repeat-associated core domain-containing protein [Simkania negevensis]